MRFLPAGLLAATCILMPHATPGATWYVPAQCPTIQAGIDSASAGDTVVVACGTYHDCTHQPPGYVSFWSVIMKSGVTLVSETGEPDCVTIDAEGAGGVVFCEEVDNTAAIAGFTIRGGVYNAGGGACLRHSSTRIRRCTFTQNRGTTGGGLYCDQSSSPLLADCLFSGNSTVTGLGMGGGVCVSSSSPTITMCTFDANSAGWGGGLFAGESAPIVTNCTFYGNSASAGGGGITCTGQLVMLGASIISFSTQGGAVACSGGSCVFPCGCDIYGNVGGDWAGCIAGMDTVNGNLWADPLLCDAPAGDFRLDSASPCASPVHNAACDALFEHLGVPLKSFYGAWGVGCGTASVSGDPPVSASWGRVKQVFRRP